MEKRGQGNMTTVDVRLKLSDEVLEYLQRESENRRVPLDDVVSDVLADYFEEPTKEEILAGIRQSMLDVLAGNVRPADEVLAELKQEFDFDADAS
jgi:predicted transcriptional regulator